METCFSILRNRVKLEGSGTQYNILPVLQREAGKAKDTLRKLYKLSKTSRV